MKSNNTTSIGQMQVRLEAATKELKNSQNALQKAAKRLNDAEAEHQAAFVAFTQAAATLRETCKVAPISAQ